MTNCRLLQVVGNLDTNSDIHLVLAGIDENSRRKKRNKDDLMGRRNEKININLMTIVLIKLHFENKTFSILSHVFPN